MNPFPSLKIDKPSPNQFIRTVLRRSHPNSSIYGEEMTLRKDQMNYP
jgi:hypothetical protein